MLCSLACFDCYNYFRTLENLPFNALVHFSVYAKHIAPSQVTQDITKTF